MIRAEKIIKTYGKTRVLNEISLHIAEGECYGLLGPNGAGKTTSIGVLSTLISPEKGTVMINGYDILKSPTACKKSIGVVSQEIALYQELSGYENLRFWGGLYGIKNIELNKRIKETLELLGLDNRQNDKVKTYSGGMKRRINIASALLHKPKVLFMDEPTVGIDPQSRNLIFEIIEKLRKEGMTIVYTTHYMEEAERLCDRIGIIDNGEIIAEGNLQELKAYASESEGVAITFTSISEQQYQSLVKFMKIKRSENTIYFYTPEVQKELAKIILKCTEVSLDITQIEIIKSNLETIFLSLTGKKLRDS
ncbi:ATP-binding cassette domain-containing protein [Flavobacteriaceae bacterium R38]|nr:ATP-binding cassette domain-containing protein [Flavobacteriaceae bacterium R38]